MSCACMYSDDHGVTWQRGESPNDGRELDGEVLSAKTISEGKQYLTESQVIELPTGELKYYCETIMGFKEQLLQLVRMAAKHGAKSRLIWN